RRTLLTGDARLAAPCSAPRSLPSSSSCACAVGLPASSSATTAAGLPVRYQRGHHTNPRHHPCFFPAIHKIPFSLVYFIRTAFRLGRATPKDIAPQQQFARSK